MNLISQFIQKVEIIQSTNCDLPIFIDRDRYVEISKYKWFINSDGYVMGRLKPCGDLITLHRFVMNIHLERNKGWIDHKDRNKRNNCKNNLRFSDAQLNAYNSIKQKGNYSSAYIGVGFRKDNKKWSASVRVMGKLKHLGLFLTEVEAAQARDKFMIKHFAEHAILNFPLDTYL